MARILVIDDNPAMLETIEAALMDAGHLVVSAATTREALHLHQGAPVDVIVTDIYMPDESGLKLIEEVRLTDARVRILAITGLGALGTPLQRAKELGANVTMEKPFHAKDLVRTVHLLLQTPV